MTKQPRYKGTMLIPTPYSNSENALSLRHMPMAQQLAWSNAALELGKTHRPAREDDARSGCTCGEWQEGDGLLGLHIARLVNQARA